MIKFRICFLLFTFSSILTAQQTVGLFQNDPSASEGYTLFSPILGTDVYLIDNCGEYVNKWDLEGRPGLMAYLMEDGTLLRTERIPSFFNAGGTGGRLRKYDWEGNLLWSYNVISAVSLSHHDVAILPNGNILVIVWESFMATAVTDMGRNPNIVDGQLWMEQILELKPIGSDNVEEVWSWHLSDHLIQDFDSTKLNYGVVSEHPEKMNINFNGGGSFPLGNNEDWVHFNSIDYNPELDQIMLSSRHFSEVWIIDHSTTTEEAASSSGGNSNKGGDLLFRWGNPKAYDRGTSADQNNFLQHDATWIKIGENQDWGFSIYNNGTSRPGPDFSQIDLVKLPILPDNNYEISANLPYGPSQPTLTISSIENEIFFNSNISGSSLLPNGNALICVGGKGEFSEIDTSTLERVWHYIVPLRSDDPVTQGETTSANSVFKVRRYAPDFLGFQNKDLSPKGLIEVGTVQNPCITSTTDLKTPLNSIKAWPNPAVDYLFLEGEFMNETIVDIYDLQGRLITSKSVTQNNSLDVSDLLSGIYLFKVKGHLPEKIIIR